MRKQQKIWHEEHSSAAALPSLAEREPSGSVVAFQEYLKNNGITPPQKIVDIGCGKGRNSVYLAKLGFQLYSMDYIDLALAAAKNLAQEIGVQNNITFISSHIDQKWPFQENFFDLAIDCFSSVDIETKAGREFYRQEMHRTLKPDGLALVAVVAAEDKIEKSLPKGPEPNSAIWPNGKFQKNYDEAELRNFYKDFKILELKKTQKPSQKLGKAYIATNYWMVIKK